MKERVEWIALIHKQNLNGRETEDELFEAGILAGIEETEEIMYSEGEVIELLTKRDSHRINTHSLGGWKSPEDWFENYKK